MTVTLPDGFLWGVAAAAHQIEGGNWNNDWWAFEHAPGHALRRGVRRLLRQPAPLRRRHRARAPTSASASYRFSIEWSRIEPEDGEFSRAALDYYRRVIATCHEHGDRAARDVPSLHDAALDGRRAAAGPSPRSSTSSRGSASSRSPTSAISSRWAARSTSPTSCRCSATSWPLPAGTPATSALYTKVTEHLRDAHTRAYDVLKAGPGDFPVGLTVSMSDWWTPEGGEAGMERARVDARRLLPRGRRAATTSSACRRTRARASASTGCRWIPTRDAETVESMGYEYWPQSLEAAIRHAIDVTGNPVYVTENGIGIDDDTTRIKFVTEALEGLGRCLADGLDVRGYIVLVAARQLRVGRGLQAALRARRRRPGDLRAHTQAQRGLARRPRPGQPAPRALDT